MAEFRCMKDGKVVRMDTRDGVVEIKVKNEIELDGASPADALTLVTNAARGLSDVSIEIDHESYYDGCTLSQYVTGWRPATADEMMERTRELAKAKAQRAQFEEQQIAQLRQSRPELFK
jgi:hypothetical protein